MSDIQKLTKRILEFRDSRDWKQFHNPKDMAIGLALEAAEALEHFQWKSKEEIEEYVKAHKEDVADELMDVLYWVLLICHDLDVDIAEAFESKMRKNEEKYSVEKVKGRKEKYTQL